MKELSNGAEGSARAAAGRLQGGFSMVEVLLALALLGIGVSLASSLLMRGQLMHDFSRRRLEQAELCFRVLAELRLEARPRRLSETLGPHTSVPLLRYRARVLPAALPDELRLVEVEVVAGSEAVSLGCRGIVPARNLLPQPTPSATAAPAGSMPSPPPASSPTSGDGGM
jgi:prepilin-type N-terminal cleavage/methylation domain-containing protein